LKRIAVLHESPKPTWTSKRLLEAARRRGCKPLYLQPSMISAVVGDGVVYHGRRLEVDAVIVRSIGRFLSLEVFLRRMGLLAQLEEIGVVVVNPYEALMKTRDKYMSIMLLRKAGVPVPETLVTEDPAEALRYAERWGDVVIKPLTGSLGLGSFRATSADQVYRVVMMIRSLGQPIYMQRFVEKKGNRDIRVFVVDGEPVAAIYRVAPPGSWKTNIARGATPIPLNDPGEAGELAVKATRALGLLYSGVDVAETGDGGYVVFEVNASPLWRGLYEATGVDPAEQIIGLVLDLLKRG